MPPILRPTPRLTPWPGPEAPAQITMVAAPLPADGWGWRSLFHPFESALGNRRRMIQFATIGMCIGLYILMRK